MHDKIESVQETTRVAMKEIRNRLLALTDQHEVTEHHGDVCWPERASKLGYLAHCLGIRGDASWSQIRECAELYDHDCPHGAPE